MLPDYSSLFPIPAAHLPARLRSLLEPVGNDPRLQIDVTSRFDADHYGPNREYVHMVMALAPTVERALQHCSDEAEDGVVSFSTPDVRDRGGLSELVPAVSGLDYIVASWGDGASYSYNLAEKVWMTLGLSPRCLGGEQQQLIYDDLALPEFGVAKGEISNEYHFSPKRDVQWTMSNEYLRRYLWMRGAYGVRVFFYEAMLADSPAIRAVMAGKPHVQLAPVGEWYQLDIREHQGGLLIQVWATVAAITPELSLAQSADGLIWPGMPAPMTKVQANGLLHPTYVYLDDRFLERYEQRSIFDSTPVKIDDQWHCSPSYRGQWSFTDCVRVGRNVVRVELRELYIPKPDREIIHAHTHVLDIPQMAEIDQGEEHVVSKTERLVTVLLDFADHLVSLCSTLGIPQTATAIVKFSRSELQTSGWQPYPELSRVAQVAPLNMTEQAFLSRCKSIHEIWQRIPNGLLRDLVSHSGHARSALKDLGSLKLLQALLNVVERLNLQGERVDAWSAGAEKTDLTARNEALAALFVCNELRIADAHDAGGVLRNLTTLGFDAAALSEGYGRALDHVFDGVIDSFAYLNERLALFLGR